MRLTATTRQKRKLRVAPPPRKGNIKIPHDGWIACAKVILIEEGIGAVKVDRVAKRLKVTRGGFYYHFKNHHALLEALLADWKANNRFVPEQFEIQGAADAAAALDALRDMLVHEKGFDSQYDMAVREWARVSIPVAEVVRKVDDARITALRKIMLGLGCEPNEADVRAKVFYYHQIGYYALGIEEQLLPRERSAPIYVRVICGELYVAARRPATTAAPASVSN